MKNLTLLFLVVFLSACGSGDSNNAANKKNTPSKKRFQNLTILLDLSDRIKQDNGMIEKDLEIINSIFKSFEERQKRFGFIASRDKICIAVASQRDNELNLFKHKDALVIDMGERGMNKPKFDIEKERLFTSVRSIYDEAQIKKTTGADIWTFFRDYARNYIKAPSKGSTFSNKMFILSDGYLVFDKDISRQRQKGTFMSFRDINSLRNQRDWEYQFEKRNLHLIPHQNINFENLQVLMLSAEPIEPELNTNEFQIIEKYWESWFAEMGIESAMYPFEDNLEITENVIGNFCKKKVSMKQ